MRKFLSLFLCFLLFGCYSDTQSDSAVHNDFENISIYEDSDIQLTITDMQYGNKYFEIRISVDNHSAYNATVSYSHFIINGIMIDTVFYLDVASGSESNGTIYFNYSDLSSAGIEELSSIESYNGSVSFEFGEGKNVDFSISSDTDYVQFIDEDGTILYSENGITVISKFKSGEYRNIIPLLIKNESGQDLHIMTNYVTVNGFTVPEIHYYSPVCDGSYRFFNIELSSWGLEENAIKKIYSASFYIDFLQTSSTEVLFQTGKLTA